MNKETNIKPGYKKTPVGIIPEDWKINKIGDFSKKVGSGKTPRGGSDVYVKDKIPFIRSQNVRNNKLDISDNVCIDEETHKEMASTKVYPEDVLLNISGASIGRSCVVPEGTPEANVNQHVCIIRLNGKLNSYYLQSHISSFNGQKSILRNQTGGNREGLNHKSVRNLKLPIPPLPEQKAIADCLSTWDRAIEKQTQLINAKKEFKKGLMQGFFNGQLSVAMPEALEGGAVIIKAKEGQDFTEDWEEVKLGDIAYITTGKSNKEDAGMDFEYTFFDRSSDVLTSKKYIYDSEAIIVPGEGADFFPKYFKGKFDLHQRAYAIMNFKRALGKFIFYRLLYSRKHLHQKAVGSTVKSLRLPNFQKMPLKMPLMELQTAIVQVLQSADKEIEFLEKKLEQLQKQKKGLMQALLTGEKRLV